MPTDTMNVPKENPRILLVEDKEIWIKLFNMWVVLSLDKPPFDFTWVQNGLEALNILHERPNDFDAILMNIEMPVMDGITATYEIRKRGYTMPIIAWSSHAAWYKSKACKDAGMNEYVERRGREPLRDLIDALHKCGVLDKEKVAYTDYRKTKP